MVFGSPLFFIRGEARDIYAFQTRKCGSIKEAVDDYFKTEKGYLAEM